MSEPTTEASEDRPTPSKRRLIPLSLDTLLAALRGTPAEPPAADGNNEPRQTPARARAAGFSFAVVSGYVVGVAGFYTNFFDTLLQATAGLVDVLGTIFLVWLATNWLRRGTSPSRRVPKPVAVWLSVICLLLMAGLTLAAVHPPGKAPLGTNETCTYDVSAGVPIPLRPGGRIKQEIPLTADLVFAVSLVIGLDETTADLTAPHPVGLRVTNEADGTSLPLDQPDIRNNRFTRFNFPRPLPLDDKPTTVVIEVTNKSQDPIGVYVKAPDEADIIPATLSGLTIRGHAGQESPYRRPDWTLSGCIAASP